MILSGSEPHSCGLDLAACWTSPWFLDWTVFKKSGELSWQSRPKRSRAPKGVSSVFWTISLRVLPVLPPETERVWNFLTQQPTLAGFVLIGGTALAMRIQHRRSNDLDLAYPETRLPRARLQTLVRKAGDE